MHFLVAAMAALTLIYGYVGRRIIQPARLNLKWKAALCAVLLIFYAAAPLAIGLRFRMPDHPATLPLAWCAYLTFGFFTLTFAALVLRDILFMGVEFTKGVVAWIRHLLYPAIDTTQIDPSRR